MNIFKHELRQNYGKAIIWILALIGFTALYLSIFSGLGDSYGEVIKNFPAAFKKTLGITSEGMSTFPTMYTVVLNMMILIGSIQAMNLGTGIISKEVSDKTADFLLSKPVTRSHILTQKLSAGLLILILTNVLFLLAAWILIQVFIDEPFQFGTFLTSSMVLLYIQLFFFFLGYFLGAVLPKVKSVIAVTLPTVFGFYIFGLLDTVIGVEKIKYITPFKFFDLHQLTAGGNYETTTFVYLGVLIGLLIVSSYIIYQRRDIHTV